MREQLSSTFGEKVRAALRLSPRTLLKSIRLSRRHTGRTDGLVVGKRTICDISDTATFNVAPDARLLFATEDKQFGATHSSLGKSKLEVTDNGTVRIDTGNARIGPCSVLHVEGDFSMGASYVNSHTRILCGNNISIGDGCAIAWNVELLDDDRHQLFVNGERTASSEPIEIQDDVWIGNNVIVKKGTTIGEGAVVASGSVVTRDVPECTLVGGNPAEVLRENVDWQ